MEESEGDSGAGCIAVIICGIILFWCLMPAQSPVKITIEFHDKPTATETRNEK